jgi:hypothetical protein
MSKFKFLYGFLIFAIIAGGFTFAYKGGLFPNMTLEAPVVTELSYVDLAAIAGKGIDSDRRGTRSMREIIVAYNLTKAEFYEALNIPEDYPDTNTVLQLITDGVSNSNAVHAYLENIVENFENK